MFQFLKKLFGGKNAQGAENKSISKNDTKPGIFGGLSRKQRRDIDAAILALNGNPNKPASVQDSIPYIAMYPDGVCHVAGRLYSKTVEFFDVNYMLADKDGQTQIFEGLCDFYNYFDPSISVQQTFISRRAAKEEFQKAINIPSAGDGFDYIRDEFSGILKSQLEKGNNGLIRTKYLTFAIECHNDNQPRPCALCTAYRRNDFLLLLVQLLLVPYVRQVLILARAFLRCSRCFAVALRGGIIFTHDLGKI